jgi:hypothetical protein
LQRITSRYCFFGDGQVADVGELHHLAFGDGVGGIGENGHDVQVFHFHHELKSAGVEKVSHQHAGRVAPRGVCRGLPAAQVGTVHHVVVKQGRGVQKLDDGRQADVIVALIAAGPGAEQNQQWPQPLAAAVDDVAADFFHQADVRGELAGNERIHRSEVCGHQP